MSITETTLPRPPRDPDFRYPQDVQRWVRELNEYLTRAIAAISMAAEDLTELQPLSPTLTAIDGIGTTAGLLEQVSADVMSVRALGVAAATSVPTRADADARYDAAGAATAAVTTHEAAADPHTAYAKGPASATDNAVARFDATTGKLLQNSPVTIDDNGVLAGHRIGAWTSNADAAVNGYVTVTDSGGTSRKLATIA